MSVLNSNEELEEAVVAAVFLEQTSFLEQTGDLSMPASNGKKSRFCLVQFFFVRREKTASWSRNGGRPMFVNQINRR